ncbi:MAG: ABC transporter substrate-binding protein, partial [Armatimonadetes bacterium]|nr:ABC transporter substrate-binding protein [Armatimonadota bacterium]
DGTPVNAEAVKRSYERILDEKNRLAYRSWFDSIETITAVDEYTVAFRTKAPFLFLANRMATPPGSIVSAAAAAQVDQKTFASAKPMGSGPFMFREWIRGSRVVLAKNPNHWLASRSNIDIIELRVVPEDSARAIGLETGEHDMTQIIAPQEADRLKANANLQVLNVPVWRINGIYFNTAKKPFDDVRVRQAVAHAMDKKAIVDTFLKGYALVADSPLPKGLWSYKSLKPFDYNPARAKQLLAQAGHPNGFSTTMWVPIGFYVNAQQISQAITEQLRAVGIQVKLEIMEGGKWLDLLRSKGPQEAQWEMSYYGWGTWSGEPDYALRLVFHSANWAPRGTNRNFYKNAEVDTLLTRGPTIVNEAERRAAYEKAQELIWNDQPWAYTFSVNQPTVAKKTLRGLKVLPTEQVVLREASLTR